MSFEAEQLRISVKSQQNRAGVLSASSSMAWVLTGCHVWLCHAGAHSSRGTALDFTAAGSAEDTHFQGVKFSWVWTAAQRELRQDALCLSLSWKSCNCLDNHHPPHVWKWKLFSQCLEKQEWWKPWKVTMSQHCWKWNSRRYQLRLLLRRRLTSDPGNKECEMTFLIWKAIKILQQVLYLKCACSSAEACKFVINNAYFFESCCCASVLWPFNLSA